MSELARKYLSASATSVESEYLFSKAENICDQIFNILQTENTECVMSLHHKYPLIKFNYK